MTGHDERDGPLADYVLGLMEAPEMAAFERRLAADPPLARDAALWRERFVELDATAAPIPPSERLWPSIAAALVGHPAAAPAAPRSDGLQGLWRSLGFWRAAGFAGAAATILLAIGVTVLAVRPEAPPRLVAVLMSADGTSPGAIVEIDQGGRARLVPLVDIPVPQGRALQVWTLPSVERGPVSVGLIEAARGIALDTAALPAIHGQQLFEITLEPESGSPIGRPTALPVEPARDRERTAEARAGVEIDPVALDLDVLVRRVTVDDGLAEVEAGDMEGPADPEHVLRLLPLDRPAGPETGMDIVPVVVLEAVGEPLGPCDVRRQVGLLEVARDPVAAHRLGAAIVEPCPFAAAGIGASVDHHLLVVAAQADPFLAARWPPDQRFKHHARRRPTIDVVAEENHPAALAAGICADPRQRLAQQVEHAVNVADGVGSHQISGAAGSSGRCRLRRRRR